MVITIAGSGFRAHATNCCRLQAITFRKPAKRARTHARLFPGEVAVSGYFFVAPASKTPY